MAELLRSLGQQLISLFSMMSLWSSSKTIDTGGLPHIPIRRLVTGHNSKGQGAIIDDRTLYSEGSTGPGYEGLRGGTLWTTTSIPSEDTNDAIDGATRKIGGQGLVMRNGTNLRFTDLAPGASSPMHRTSSIDYNILISGKIICVMEDGSETLIEITGDTVIMKGGMHAWRNPGPNWARWISVLVDAKPATVNGETLEDAWLA